MMFFSLELNRLRLQPALVCVLGAVAAMSTCMSHARPQYVDQVPTVYGCPTCHLDERDRQLRTGFGIDFALARGVWAVDDDPGVGLCGLDSDRDGVSNGAELNDPQCLWRPGQAKPGGMTTDPSNSRDPNRCSDGWIQTGEECDGQRLGNETCVSLGFGGGELSCTADCFFDTTLCENLSPRDMGTDTELDQGRIDASPDGQNLDSGIEDLSGLFLDAHAPHFESVLDAALVSNDDAVDGINEYSMTPESSMTDGAIRRVEEHDVNHPSAIDAGPGIDTGLRLSDLDASMRKMPSDIKPSSPRSGCSALAAMPVNPTGLWWVILLLLLRTKKRIWPAVHR